MWFEARYFDPGFGPMGKLETVIPPGPDGNDNLLDACLAFFPAAFEKCPSYAAVLKGHEPHDHDQSLDASI
jgi:hypothetical protein